MVDASSADCKKFIEDNAAAMGWPTSGAWKRCSKTKTGDGWLRVFDHGSGVEIVIVEPVGTGAAGLRVAGSPLGSLAVAPLGKSASAMANEVFKTASEGMRAALRWIDAMRVLGGKRAVHTPDAGPAELGEAPKTWSDFKRDCEDFSGKESSFWAGESLQAWVELGMSNPFGRPLMLSRVSWCFSNDADHLHAQGYWKPSDGVDVFAWPTDAEGADSDLTAIPNPLYQMPYDNQMECVWLLGEGAVSGKDSMVQAWERLRADGVSFDLAGQKKYGQDSDYDEAEPLHVKVHRIIPELIAAKEAKALGKAAAPAAAASKRGMAL